MADHGGELNLSANFTLSQLTASETAIRRSIPNDPTPEQIANLTDLAATLEQVKHLVGPIHINSAFRSVRLNSYIGGSPTSAHLSGYACDFTAEGFGTPKEVCQAIAGSGIPFDQLIEEGNWVHISVSPPLRQEILTAHWIGGKVSYSAGLGSNETRAA